MAEPLAAGTKTDQPTVARFEKRTEAEQLVRSLRTLGNQARTVKQIEKIELKTLSLGPYADEAEALKAVNTLQAKSIKSWSHKANNGFLVHAGAMQEDKHFQQRFDMLREMGYENILTGTTAYDKHYYLVLSPARLRHDKRKRRFRLMTELNSQLNRWSVNSQIYSQDALQLRLHSSSSSSRHSNWRMGLEIDTLNEADSLSAQLKPWQTLARTHTRLGNYQVSWNLPVKTGSQSSMWQQPLAQMDIRSFPHPANEMSDAATQSLVQAQWALRKYTLALNWQPLFEATRLPRRNSHWYPTDTQRGLLRGYRSHPTLVSALSQNTTEIIAPKYGGVSLQLQSKSGRREQAFVFAWSPSPEPLFIQSLGKIAIHHPRLAIFSMTENTDRYGFHTSLIHNYPLLTTTLNQSHSLALIAGSWHQLLLNHHRTRIVIAPSVRQLGSPEPVLNQTTRLRLDVNAQHRLSSRPQWRSGINFSSGFYMPELFIQPWLGYQLQKRMQLKLMLDWFWGMQSTEYGYHKSHNRISINWKTQY